MANIWLASKMVIYLQKDGTVMKRAVKGLNKSLRNENVVSWDTFKKVLSDSYEADRPRTEPVEEAFLDYVRSVQECVDGKKTGSAAKETRRLFQPRGINATIIEKYDHLVTLTMKRHAMSAVYLKRKVSNCGIFTFPMFL